MWTTSSRNRPLWTNEVPSGGRAGQEGKPKAPVAQPGESAGVGHPRQSLRRLAPPGVVGSQRLLHRRLGNQEARQADPVHQSLAGTTSQMGDHRGCGITDQRHIGFT